MTVATNAPVVKTVDPADRPDEAAVVATAVGSGGSGSCRSKPGWCNSCEMGSFLKYLSLGILVLQTTSLVLVLRYSRTRAGNGYLSSTAVVMVEVTKVVASCFMVFALKGFRVVDFLQTLWDDVIGRPKDTLKMLVPSALYVVQNNLLYAALTTLDAATYQVTYQLKILTTAMFSVAMLQKKLETFQWVSLLLLVAGVSFVQIPSSSPVDKPKTSFLTSAKVMGLLAVITASFSSGFAGVYFEKVLKNTQQSLWIRNIQLGLFGLLFGLAGVALNDFRSVKEGGFFQGYDHLTWVVIELQAFGGILVAVVIKYADNILKSFASSLSIVLSVVFSYFILGDLTASRYFLLGTAVVLGATILYAYQPHPASSHPVSKI